MGHKRRFKQGEHVCAIYDSAEEQYAVAAAFLADGLLCHERCLYSATSASELDRFRHALRQTGVAPLREEQRGALLMVTSDETHLAAGSGCYGC